MFADTPICPSRGVCDQPHLCFTKCKRWVGPTPIDTLLNKSALHFVGFKDDRYWNAVRIFGQPDFVHRVWDHRAKDEIMDGDTAVFAQYDPSDVPTDFSWNDSERF